MKKLRTKEQKLIKLLQKFKGVTSRESLNGMQFINNEAVITDSVLLVRTPYASEEHFFIKKYYADRVRAGDVTALSSEGITLEDGRTLVESSDAETIFPAYKQVLPESDKVQKVCAVDVKKLKEVCEYLLALDVERVDILSQGMNNPLVLEDRYNNQTQALLMPLRSNL